MTSYLAFRAPQWPRLVSNKGYCGEMVLLLGRFPSRFDAKANIARSILSKPLCTSRRSLQASSLVMTLPPIASVIRVEAASSTSALLAGNVTSRKIVSSTKWLQLLSLTYTRRDSRTSDSELQTRHWDAAERCTKRDGASADAVTILARLYSGKADAKDNPRILLVKQFRPPVNAICIELPAGLIDPGESPADAAIRELKEETGFVGKVVHVSAPEPLSPGFSSETVCTVHVDIDGFQSPSADLDDSESIQVVSVPMLRLREALDHMMQTEKCVVMHGVGTLAAGIELSASLDRP